MYHLPSDFTYYLRSLRLSASTSRNYHADLVRFIRWFEKITRKPFSAHQISASLIRSYRQDMESHHVPPNSINRYVTSLNQFLKWIGNQPIKEVHDSKNSRIVANFVGFLRSEGLSSRSVRSYRGDLIHFIVWFEKTTGHHFLSEKLCAEHFFEYQSYLQTLHIAQSSIKRYLTFLRKFFSWANPDIHLPAHPKPFEKTGQANDMIGGAVSLAAGEQAKTITPAWPRKPKSVIITASYPTASWVEQITETGFTAKAVTPPVTDQMIYWFAIW